MSLLSLLAQVYIRGFSPSSIEVSLCAYNLPAQQYPLSPSNWNPQVEKGVVELIDAIHALNVVHGDIQLENMLVAEENSNWRTLKLSGGQGIWHQCQRS